MTEKKILEIYLNDKKEVYWKLPERNGILDLNEIEVYTLLGILDAVKNSIVDTWDWERDVPEIKKVNKK